MLLSDKEREVASLIQRLNTIKNMKATAKEQKFKEKQRIKDARDKPRQDYYEAKKKQQKSDKMASLMRKKRKDERSTEKRNARSED